MSPHAQPPGREEGGGEGGGGGGLSKESYLQPDCLALRTVVALAESSASLAASSEKVVVYF